MAIALTADITRLRLQRPIAVRPVASSDNPLKMRMRVHVGGRDRKFELHLLGACQAKGESVFKEQGHVVRFSVLVSVGCFVHARVWRFIPRTKDLDHLFLLADSQIRSRLQSIA
jgi:hypothetical protein